MAEKKKRNLIAIDETVIRMSMMKVYLAMIDKASWLKRALESLNLEFEHEGFREEKLG